MAHLHVQPNGDTWEVITEKGTRVSSGHRKKQRAIAEMNNAARQGDVKYYHGRDGRVIDVRTHSG